MSSTFMGGFLYEEAGAEARWKRARGGALRASPETVQMLFQKPTTSLREADEKDGMWREYATSGAPVVLINGGRASGKVWRRWRTDDQRWQYRQHKPFGQR
jgi:hypothetical protein